MLTKSLPLESRTARALGATKPGDWTVSDHLLAIIGDEVRAGNYLFVKAHSKKGAIVQEPKPIPRPSSGDEEEQKRPASAEELVDFVAKRKGRTTPRKSRGIVRYVPKGPRPEEEEVTSSE